MVLHIYNPEHDIALGKNTVFFTPPKAARITRDAFCHRPALWAEDGDWVLVDYIELAERNLKEDGRIHADVRFVTKADLARLKAEDMPEKVESWGWDRFLVAQLIRCNPLFAPLMPSEEYLDRIRMFSSRQFVAEVLLPKILATDEILIGEMTVCRDEEEIYAELQKNNGCIVAKSPWSCSGRGVRFLNNSLTQSELGWIRNTLIEQGGVLVEPQYDKVLDFAMEFYANGTDVEYRGLNIFETRSGAYLGNVEGSKDEKLALLGSYVPLDVIERLKSNIISITTDVFCNAYEGPFGIDMMVVRGDENEYENENSKSTIRIHPCVEMNLRRTMGQI
ncbi:MAG: hypothetical protein Q4D33_06785 [Prevotellaceae bacterium]|nr:hypothetical protein [Prevotellaceae bacterium]